MVNGSKFKIYHVTEHLVAVAHHDPTYLCLNA